MSEVIHEEALEAVSMLLDCIDLRDNGFAVLQAKIAVSYIQQNERLRREMLEVLEECLGALPLGEEYDLAVSIIAKAKGEQG